MGLVTTRATPPITIVCINNLLNSQPIRLLFNIMKTQANRLHIYKILSSEHATEADAHCDQAALLLWLSLYLNLRYLQITSLLSLYLLSHRLG